MNAMSKQPVPTHAEKLKALLASAKSTSISPAAYELWRRAEKKRGRA